MIKNNCFSKEWISEKSIKIKSGRGKADPELIEKVIYALHLLESLSKHGVEFVFKGGTCLLLLLQKIHRFSIDIDIIIELKNKGNIDFKLDDIITQSKYFHKYEEQTRKSNNDILKSHYKFFYNSTLDETEKYILLDILYEEEVYCEIIENKILCEFIELEEDSMVVCTPSIDCILGDKLTAFAPNTTGIPYNKSKELEIIKQLFDVSNLFDEINDVNIVAQTFKKIAAQELKYRNQDEFNYIDVLDDIFKTAIIISSRGVVENLTFKMLEDGIRRIKPYIFSKNFIAENAIECAAKAAYIASVIKNELNYVEKYNTSINMNDISIKNKKYAKMFKGIKKFSPEAYYYLNKALELNEKLSEEIIG